MQNNVSILRIDEVSNHRLFCKSKQYGDAIQYPGHKSAARRDHGRGICRTQSGP